MVILKGKEEWGEIDGVCRKLLLTLLGLAQESMAKGPEKWPAGMGTKGLVWCRDQGYLGDAWWMS